MSRTFTVLIKLLLLLFVIQGHAQNTKISGGFAHSLFLCENGKVFSWGNNTYGQLGRDESTQEDINPDIVQNLNNVVAIDAGKGNFSMALTNDSTLWTWGQNNQWQLGTDAFCSPNNSCTSTAQPQHVLGGETGDSILQHVIAFCAGLTQSYALLKSGEVVAWGDNYYGQLGNGNTTREKFPVYVRKSDGSHLQNIVYIAAGAFFGIAITVDGKVWGWGKNSENELGCGNKLNHSYAIQILNDQQNLLSNIAQASCGFKHALFLTKTGEVYGTGDYLGSNSFDSKIYYSTVSYAKKIDDLNAITSIACGFSHNIVIKKIGSISTVLSWGDNKNISGTALSNGGQLGIGNDSIIHSFTPVSVLNSNGSQIENVTSISASNGNCFIFTKNEITGSKTLLGTGINFSGQLGTRDNMDYYSATKIIMPRCYNNCQSVFLGDNKTLCNPINDTLKILIPSVNYIYTWYFNNTQLGNSGNSLPFTNEGLYALQITDTTKKCNTSIDEIEIKKITPPYTLFDYYYCGDSTIVKSLNNEESDWYTQKTFGKYIGSGTNVIVDITKLKNYPNDTTKILWMYTPTCQPMPVFIKKRCKTCTIQPPLTHSSSEYCTNEPIHIYADGTNIRWYKGGSNSIFSIGNNLKIDNTKESFYYFLVTQNDSVCESKADTIYFSVSKCIPHYSVSGQIHPKQKTYLKFFDFDQMPAIINQQYSMNDGSYIVEIPQDRRIIILAETANTSQYESTYFGNSESINKAAILTVDANIGDADINLQPKLESTIKSNKINIWPTDIKTNCTITLPSNNHFKITICSALGYPILTLNNQTGMCTLDLSSLPSGLFLIKIDGNVISETIKVRKI